jgi:anti-sigma factor ChrR (cupin superfamily)
MTRKKLEELAAEYGLGVLSPAEATQLEALIAHDAEARQEVAAFIDTAAALAAASSPAVEPSVELRTRILGDIALTPQSQRETTEARTPEGYSFLLHSQEGWEDTAFPGFRSKLLSSGPGPDYQVMLIALDPGAKVPEHDHTGTEQIYMLSGHLHTEGRVMGPGDFLRADAGTRHQDVVSPDGCVALLILAPSLAA